MIKDKIKILLTSEEMWKQLFLSKFYNEDEGYDELEYGLKCWAKLEKPKSYPCIVVNEYVDYIYIYTDDFSKYSSNKEPFIKGYFLYFIDNNKHDIYISFELFWELAKFGENYFNEHFDEWYIKKQEELRKDEEEYNEFNKKQKR